MLAKLPAIEGAAEALWRLSDAGVWIRVITHRLYVNWGHAEAVGDTVQWLDAERIPYRDICFLGNKPEVEADCYVDDAPHNISALRAGGNDVIVFDQPYNRDQADPRARRLAEVEQAGHGPVHRPGEAPRGSSPNFPALTAGKDRLAERRSASGAAPAPSEHESYTYPAGEACADLELCGSTPDRNLESNTRSHNEASRAPAGQAWSWLGASPGPLMHCGLADWCQALRISNGDASAGHVPRRRRALHGCAGPTSAAAAAIGERRRGDGQIGPWSGLAVSDSGQPFDLGHEAERDERVRRVRRTGIDRRAVHLGDRCTGHMSTRATWAGSAASTDASATSGAPAQLRSGSAAAGRVQHQLGGVLEPVRSMHESRASATDSTAVPVAAITSGQNPAPGSTVTPPPKSRPASGPRVRDQGTASLNSRWCGSIAGHRLQHPAHGRERAANSRMPSPVGGATSAPSSSAMMPLMVVDGGRLDQHGPQPSGTKLSPANTSAHAKPGVWLSQPHRRHSGDFGQRVSTPTVQRTGESGCPRRGRPIGCAHPRQRHATGRPYGLGVQGRGPARPDDPHCGHAKMLAQPHGGLRLLRSASCTPAPVRCAHGPLGPRPHYPHRATTMVCGSSARPLALPLLFAALTGRSGHGLTTPTAQPPSFAAPPLGLKHSPLLFAALTGRSGHGLTTPTAQPPSFAAPPLGLLVSRRARCQSP